jgi:excisionase family DNA binding protein
MPRARSDETALFVRIPAAEAAKLHRAADVLKTPKRELITKLVARYVDPEDLEALHELGGPIPGQFTVAVGEPETGEYSLGRHWFRPTETPEVLTSAQLADFIQVDEETVLELAEKGELPGRKLGEKWRFSREAVLAWLAASEEP